MYELSNQSIGPSAFHMPTVVEKTPTGERWMDIPSLLLKSRIVMLHGAVSDELAYAVKAQLMYLDSLSSDDIEVHIHSPGGSVYAGYVIVDQIKQCRSNVMTICSGYAASMGCFILSAGTRGKRFATPRSAVMAHQVISGGNRASFQDLRVDFEHTANLNKQLMVELAANVGQDYDQFMLDCDRDKWINAKEALNYGEYGFIDGIIPDVTDETRGKSVLDRVIRRGGNI